MVSFTKLALVLGIVSLAMNFGVYLAFSAFGGQAEMINNINTSKLQNPTIDNDFSSVFQFTDVIKSLFTGNYVLLSYFGLNEVSLYYGGPTIDLAAVFATITWLIYFIGLLQFARGMASG